MKPYYERAGVSIFNGDCLRLMPELPSASFDLIVTDPQYFLPAEHYQTRTNWARSLSDLSILEHFFGAVFTECRRILKPDGALAVFCDGQSYPVMYVQAYSRFDRITDIVWNKGVIGMGNGVRRQHELIMVAVPPSFNWGSWQRSVLQYSPVPSEEKEHPAQKPVPLLTCLCQLLAPKGGKVLDPFAGSGSTGCAAALAGMDFTGIELEPRYCEIAARRLSQCVLPLALG